MSKNLPYVRAPTLLPNRT